MMRMMMSSKAKLKKENPRKKAEGVQGVSNLFRSLFRTRMKKSSSKDRGEEEVW
jgi:hypothetical protein